MLQPQSTTSRSKEPLLLRAASWRLSYGLCVFLLLGFLTPLTCHSQIDPYRRQLLQFGYNQAIEGHWPTAGYLFYLLNQPDFLRPDLTLRLALAPTYLDSEF